MDSILKCNDIADLDNLLKTVEEETGFEHGRVQVFNDDEGTYAIKVDREYYSTFISIEEAESTIRDLFNGIKLVKKIIKVVPIDVLDKIRIEIEELKNAPPSFDDMFEYNYAVDDVLYIIDKYKAEK